MRPAEAVVAAVAARAKRENFILMADEIKGLTICERRGGGEGVRGNNSLIL